MEFNELKGFEPLLAEAESFEIEGRTYRFIRLGTRHTAKLFIVLKQALMLGYREAHLLLTSAMSEDQELLAILTPLLGIPECYDYILEFLGDSVVEVLPTPEVVKDTAGNPIMVQKDGKSVEMVRYTRRVNIDDPLQFPMGSEFTMLLNLVSHPDIESFLVSLRGVSKHPRLLALMERGKQILKDVQPQT